MATSPRDESLDLLRVIGMLIIFTAHGGAPGWVIQPIGFGVVLLIITSGMSHRLLLDRKQPRIGPFLRQRLTRIVVPVWLFLALYLPLTWAACALLGEPFPWSREVLLETAVLGDGFGYVWIFRIYALLALATMPILALSRRVRSLPLWGLGVAGVLLGMELVTPRVLAQDLSPEAVEWMRLVVLAVPAYTAVFALGLRLHEASHRQLLAGAAIALAAVLANMLPEVLGDGSFTGPRAHKYPPRLYYVAYGLFGTLSLALVRQPLARRVPREATVWFSRNTLWVYLWHIPLVHNLDGLAGLLGLPLPWPVRSILLMTFGIGCTLVQHALVRRIVRPSSPGALLWVADLLGVRVQAAR